MNLHDQTVGAYCDCGFGDRLNVGADTGCVARIDENRQMALGADNRYGADVQRVPGGGFVGADAALTEYDAGIAFGGDVFRRVQPFVDGCG